MNKNGYFYHFNAEQGKMEISLLSCFWGGCKAEVTRVQKEGLLFSQAHRWKQVNFANTLHIA